MHTLSLDGTWLLRGSDGQRTSTRHVNNPTIDRSRYIEATVPGEVHLDLMRQGMLPDPCVGANVLACRWVEDNIWSYRREFDAPAEALGSRAWLVFDGLDYAATIVLNGQEIGKHENTFYPCRLDVTGKLREGNNYLVVHLDGGLYHVADKPAKGVCMSPDQALNKRHWLRKPQCQFAWDWSPRLINVGIFKPVRLEWTAKETPARLDQFVPLASLSADLKTGTLVARQFVEGLGNDVVEGELEVTLSGKPLTSVVKVQIKPGLNPVETTLAVANPDLWWPIGHGPQNLYTVIATLRVAGRVIGSSTASVGFRHVRINQDPHPSGHGRYFIIEVNGRKIFAKGGNFVPADLIFARIDRARYETLVDRAVEANFNFLRIWGGGLYESDEFYDICNRRGILVWQEFIYACGRYPTYDEEFFKNVRTEAVWNIRRLARHPSLVVWCGNNEMEVGNWDWGYGDSGHIMPDHGWFHVTLPRLMEAEDPTRYYQPSSPISPPGPDGHLIHPNADHAGDQHPWTVGFANTDFRDYRKMACRFPNEGGILGPNALPTMLECVNGDNGGVHSHAWRVHDNAIDGWNEPSYADAMMNQWLGKEMRSMSVEDYVYWGGLVQGEGIREYIENFRRRMFDTSSAIFWMYNDCWPATRSWTVVDYRLRRTPAFWGVRRAMSPVHVVVTQEDDRVVVYGINETQSPVSGTLRFGVMNLAGGYPVDEKITGVLTPNASTRLAEFPMSQWKDPTVSVAFAHLSDGQRVLARNRLLLPLFKEIRWPKAQVSVRHENGRATFTSDTFAWGVCVDLHGERALADNFFDVWPGVPHVIDWSETEPPRVLRVGNLT